MTGEGTGATCARHPGRPRANGHRAERCHSPADLRRRAHLQAAAAEVCALQSQHRRLRPASVSPGSAIPARRCQKQMTNASSCPEAMTTIAPSTAPLAPPETGTSRERNPPPSASATRLRAEAGGSPPPLRQAPPCAGVAPPRFRGGETDHCTLRRHRRHRWTVSAGTKLNRLRTARPTSQNGQSSRVVVTIEARAMVAESDSVVPTGGVYSPIARLSTIITPS